MKTVDSIGNLICTGDLIRVFDYWGTEHIQPHTVTKFIEKDSFGHYTSERLDNGNLRCDRLCIKY